jgi:hypothetical protein
MPESKFCFLTTLLDPLQSTAHLSSLFISSYTFFFNDMALSCLLISELLYYIVYIGVPQGQAHCSTAEPLRPNSVWSIHLTDIWVLNKWSTLQLVNKERDIYKMLSEWTDYLFSSLEQDKHCCNERLPKKSYNPIFSII